MSKKTAKVKTDLDARALLAVQISKARQALEDPDLDREERIHAARRLLKRARSMLRILRPILTDADYDRRRAVLRDAAADLSGTRDLDVMSAAAARLKVHAPNKLHAALDELAARLARDAARAHADETPADAVARRLAAAEADTDTIPNPSEPRRLFEDELVRAYKSARKAMDKARLGVGEHPFHEWRKRVKHHWHLMRLIKGTCAAASKKTVRQLDDLGEILGLENDHAVLSAKLLDDPLLAGDGPSADRIHDVIDARRADLQTKALKRGEKIYGEQAAGFRSRIDLG